MSDEEHGSPTVEEGGGCATHVASSSDVQLSPVKDSPSRRKRLMGSLRSIGSLRSVRSSPTKDKCKYRPASPYPRGPIEPDSPSTPPSSRPGYSNAVVESGVRPSPSLLALNFQESPSDQPMFDLQQRERSVSTSSMVVQRSSPMPIPVAAHPHRPSTVSRRSSELPAGTIPCSPAPLQVVLDDDPDQFVLSTEPSPSRAQTGTNAEHVPTPMPGTNVGFDDDDLSSVCSGYFDSLTEVEGPFCIVPSELLPGSGWVTSETQSLDSGTAKQTEVDALKETDRVLQSDSLPRSEMITPKTIPDIGAATQTEAHDLERPHVAEAHHHDAPAYLNSAHVHWKCTNCGHIRSPPLLPGLKPGPRSSTHSPSLIEDASRMDRDTVEPGAAACQLTHQQPSTENVCPAEIRAGERDPAQDRAQRSVQVPQQSVPQALPILDARCVTWGTHGSLYDGNGYGSSRPSTSSASPIKTSTSFNGLVRPAVGSGIQPIEQRRAQKLSSFDEESPALALEYAAMGEVIRAYAAYEDGGVAGMGNDEADVQIAKRESMCT